MTIVFRETLSSKARSRLDGMRTPSGRRPSSIAATIIWRIWSCRKGPDRSNAPNNDPQNNTSFGRMTESTAASDRCDGNNLPIVTLHQKLSLVDPQLLQK